MKTLLLFWILFGQTPSEVHILKTFYLRDGTQSQRLTDILTTLRQQLNLRYMIINTAVNGIMVRDTPERVAQAQNLLTQFELRDSSAAVAVNSESQPDPVHIVQTFYLGDSSTQRDLVEIVTALRALLNIHYVAANKNAKAVTIRDTSSQIAVSRKVIADLDRSQPSAGLQASAAIDAGRASEVRRRDLGGTERHISLSNAQTEEGIREIVVALRTLLNHPQVEATGNTIVLRDTENNLLVAERIVADLDKPVRK
jgi:type II secretory pathway component GspD/PulD (secretin)